MISCIANLIKSSQKQWFAYFISWQWHRLSNGFYKSDPYQIMIMSK